jgi:hypothetical protein
MGGGALPMAGFAAFFFTYLVTYYGDQFVRYFTRV